MKYSRHHDVQTGREYTESYGGYVHWEATSGVVVEALLLKPPSNTLSSCLFRKPNNSEQAPIRTIILNVLKDPSGGLHSSTFLVVSQRCAEMPT